MLGIILCGGQSLRMGADKGLMNYEDRIWAQLAAEKLSSLDISSVFSVNSAQQQIYTTYFGQEKLVVDQPDLRVKGPLLGVLSAHLLNEEEDLFLLACDLILMDSRLLKLLFNSKTNDAFDAYIFTKNGQQEPLCGIYKSQGLKKIMDMLHTTGLEKHSMKFILSKLHVYETVLDEKDYRYFTNFNSHSELNGL